MKKTRVFVGTTSIIAACGVGNSNAVAAPVEAKVVVGHYKGQEFDMSKGWAGANTCVVVDSNSAKCFDSLKEAAAAFGVDSAQVQALEHDQATVSPRLGGAGAINASPSAAMSAAAACTADGALILYDGINLTGQNLVLLPDNFWQNAHVPLGPLGFDNRTSSWKNANCTQQLAFDNANGAAPPSIWLWGGGQANGMNGGWNNAISSMRLFP
jgi:hypothetical protein